MTIYEIAYKVSTTLLCENVYVDLDGTLKAKKFPRKGIWYFDGQFYYQKATHDV